jgi:hypothetical protein
VASLKASSNRWLRHRHDDVTEDLSGSARRALTAAEC